MRDLNKVMLIGNLTKDPEARTTPSGQSVTSFGVATNRSWTDAQGAKQEAVEFIDIVAWGKLGEIIGQYSSKGRKVYIEGRLQTRSWDAQDGSKKYKTEVIASDVILLDRAGSGPSNVEREPAGKSEAPVAEVAGVAASGFSGSDEINIEDIPF